MTAIRSSSALVPVLYLLLWVGICHAAGAKLPGPPVNSPNGRWQITSQEPSDGVEFHRLVLVDRSTGSMTAFDRFPRHADVLWSPDSERIAVTDFSGSDESDCRVALRSGADRLSVRQAIEGTPYGKLAADNHHAYIKCSRWIGTSTIEFEVSAYGDANPKGASKRGRLNVATGEINGARAGAK